MRWMDLTFVVLGLAMLLLALVWLADLHFPN
jgi:hypothetical protein